MGEIINQLVELFFWVPMWLRIAAAPILLLGAIYLAFARYNQWQTSKKRRKLTEDEYASRFLSQFHKDEIEGFLSGYVVPKCAPADPTNREGEEYLADIQQSIFEYMDANLNKRERSYNLILADTGMGKTMFCLNYYAHRKKCDPELNICLVSLASKTSEEAIRSVVNKADTLLIADAFDEDPKAIGRGRERLDELLEIAADYRAVVITCRSQYFVSDDAIPRETPLPVLVPRQLGQSQNSSLIRSYIAPFSQREVDTYISKQFPFYKPWRFAQRKRAMDLIKSVPDLSHRPMLLERLPDLAKQPSKSNELYDLYDLLVEGWLKRESRWISFENLKTVSLELALSMYRDFENRRGRMKRDEVNYIAENHIQKNPEWKHLTARSLLNRDSQGNYKFAHKSILEFLVVKSVCEGDDRGLEMPWTAFMKEIFISWGHSEKGKGRWKRARAILASEHGRSHVAPLFDLLGTSAVRGYPKFKAICERRNTSTGERLAPASWRESSMETINDEGRGVIRIVDREYNLDWVYIPNNAAEGVVDARLLDVLRFAQKQPNLRFPSFEQFVTLVEGLYRIKSDLFRDKSMFILEDKPGRHYQLIAQLNSEVVQSPILKPLVKKMRVVGTSVYVNVYQAGAAYEPQYATDLKVDQLYVDDNRPNLFTSALLK